jgi:hypothetical protein
MEQHEHDGLLAGCLGIEDVLNLCSPRTLNKFIRRLAEDFVHNQSTIQKIRQSQVLLTNSVKSNIGSSHD